MLQHSLLETVLKVLADEEQKVALEVGRGKVSKENRDERIGVAKGLKRAIDLVNETAQAAAKEDIDP